MNGLDRRALVSGAAAAMLAPWGRANVVGMGSIACKWKAGAGLLSIQSW